MSITDEQAIAYLATEYHVIAPSGRIVLHAFERSMPLQRLHESQGVTGSAFLTAFNPLSEPVDDERNHRYQEGLVADVQQRWKFLPGEGVDPTGVWPAEPSILVLGIERDEALALGRKYRQNAIVVANQEGKTELLACEAEDQATITRHLKVEDRPDEQHP